MFLISFTSLSVLLLFPLLITFFVIMVLYSIISNINDILSINPSANEFVFRDFNVHHKDWLIYSRVTDRPCELCYDFICCELCYLEGSYSDDQLSYLDPWLWLSQSCSFRFIHFFWHKYLF